MFGDVIGVDRRCEHMRLRLQGDGLSYKSVRAAALLSNRLVIGSGFNLILEIISKSQTYQLQTVVLTAVIVHSSNYVRISHRSTFLLNSQLILHPYNIVSTVITAGWQMRMQAAYRSAGPGSADISPKRQALAERCTLIIAY